MNKYCKAFWLHGYNIPFTSTELFIEVLFVMQQIHISIKLPVILSFTCLLRFFFLKLPEKLISVKISIP